MIFLRENSTERAINLAEHMIKTKDTVRKAAAKFGVSKSTVHTDGTKRNGMGLCQKSRMVVTIRLFHIKIRSYYD
ncbi:MAG: sporulation transcriptional regulator SpoIIID [Clostridia bacterium]|nr:sporulation transcriptional regulator SpoIIID [Clostridia bacterium]